MHIHAKHNNYNGKSEKKQAGSVKIWRMVKMHRESIAIGKAFLDIE